MKLQNIVYVLTVGGALLTSCSDLITAISSVQVVLLLLRMKGCTAVIWLLWEFTPN